ncbi:MAG: ribonuclease J [Vicinamibacterales bacterium]
MDTDRSTVEIVPLGGLREFGMNMMLISCEGTSILVDAGVLFPEPELLGVDLVIPDLSHLDTLPAPVAALVLTHGHEDHIGGVPYVASRFDGPIYGTPLTLALVEPKLDEHGMAEVKRRLVRVDVRRPFEVGPFSIECLRVTHSMPDCVALAIHTPAGTIVHTGDFKIDQTPIDRQPVDLHRFAELGQRGVLALFADSTNVDRRGVTGSETDVVDAFEEIFTSTVGKVVVATFGSSIYRMQLLVNLAARFDRKVAFVGRGVVENSQIAAELGHLTVPDGLQIRDSDVRHHPPSKVLCITTGSQGEPLAALSRIAIDDHRHIGLAPDDVVVFSARPIPGNEKAIGRVMNHLAHRGADVVYEGLKHVHVSGHASEEELKLMLSLVRPKFFIPIHGEYRQLARHARVARHVLGDTTTVVVAQNGDRLSLGPDRAEIVGRATTGRVLIDGARTGEVADEVLRDRRHLAGDGLVVPVLAINRQSGMLEGVPEVVTRGFIVDDRTEAVLQGTASMLAEIVDGARVEERTDIGLMKERVRGELQRAIKRRSGRRPLVLPVIMEI